MAMNEGGPNESSPAPEPSPVPEPPPAPSEPPPRPWGAPANEPHPYGAPAPQANPYAALAMPDALGVPPPPPPVSPPPPAYGAMPAAQYAPRPQYPNSAYAPMPGYGLPPPPPPPPGMGMPGFGIPKPHSGKATASLVCAGVGLVGGAMCFLPAIAIPIGLVLGFMGIAETGANGQRSGRGIAITGTILNALLLVGSIGAVIAFVAIAQRGSQAREEHFTTQTDADFDKIRARLRQYYDANNKSLGPGGPRLARDNTYSSYGNVPAKPKRKVVDVLKIEDLFGQGELDRPPNYYELTVTGSNSATVRVHDWGRNSRGRVLKIFDIELGQYTIEDE